MLSALVLVFLIFGAVKLSKLAANNPKQSMDAARWIKGMFGK